MTTRRETLNARNSDYTNSSSSSSGGGESSSEDEVEKNDSIISLSSSTVIIEKEEEEGGRSLVEEKPSMKNYNDDIKTSTTNNNSIRTSGGGILSSSLSKSSNTFFDSKDDEDQDNNSRSSSSSGSSDSDDTKSYTDVTSAKKGPGTLLLDNPFRYFGGTSDEGISGQGGIMFNNASKNNLSSSAAVHDSVLRVEFREQAAQKTALMERHVKMSVTDGSVQKINGKTVCWQYRKGKCRFGHNCKFAHDSDILNPFGESVPKNNFESTDKIVPKVSHQAALTNSSTTINGGESSSIMISSSAQLSGERKRVNKDSSSIGMISDDEDESISDSKKKKKRPGLSSTLTPGKKVMGMYYKNKSSHSHQ